MGWMLISVIISAILLTNGVFGGKHGDDMLGSAFFLINLKVEGYILPFLNYSTEMLEPYIAAETVEAHYTGHHNNYRLKLNAVRKQWITEHPKSELAKESVLYHLQNLKLVPEKYRRDIRNHGGGFVNHALYFGVMSPNLEEEERKPLDYMMEEITTTFGGWDKFREQFEKEALSLFGSGYVWLVRKTGKNGSLYITTSANQDSPINDGDFPILVIDVWEHAYYLQHKYVRKDYVSNWWGVVDWHKVMALDTFWKRIQFPDPEEKKEEL